MEPTHCNKTSAAAPCGCTIDRSIKKNVHAAGRILSAPADDCPPDAQESCKRRTRINTVGDHRVACAWPSHRHFFCKAYAISHWEDASLKTSGMCFAPLPPAPADSTVEYVTGYARRGNRVHALPRGPPQRGAPPHCPLPPNTARRTCQTPRSVPLLRLRMHCRRRRHEKSTAGSARTSQPWP